MVALISGNGLGLFNASNILGGAGKQGQNSSGQQSYVNASNGNLVLQFQDEQLSGITQNLLQLRTYNSQGGQTDGDGDSWRWNGERKVALSGTVNTAGSTVSRTTGDGHVAVYSWSASNNRYESHEGDGAEDTLVWNSSNSTWTWIDGYSRNKDTYNGSGQLTQQTDVSGNAITYAYSSGRLSSITDTGSGQKLVLTYATVPANTSLTRLQKVDTYSLTNDTNGRATSTLGTAITQVSYSYDNLGRLISVSTDLSADNSIADGKVFTTTYSYDGTSFRISQITQGEGTTLNASNSTTVSYIYDSSFRVRTVTDANGSQTFTYNTGSTSITNGVGQTWIYTYDANGQLIQLQSPAVNGQIITTQYQYDSNGNVTQTTDGLGNTITYQYDANDNCISEIDSLYNTITRTYDANNQLITETHYLTPGTDGVDTQNGLPVDPDAPANPTPATDPITTRYAYDTNSRLRYAVSAEGRVTEYRYNTQGLQTSVISYAGGAYSVSGLSSTVALTESQLNTWVTSQDKTQSTLSQSTYDYRGNLAQIIQYATVDSAGNGVLDNAADITQYIYDEYGNLLKTIAVRGTSRTTTTAINAAGNTVLSSYVYDGMGRAISVVNSAGTTSTSYSNSSRQVSITNAAGLTTVSAYDNAGRLISVVQSATGETARQTLYYYDAAGKLNMVQDAAGGRSYSFYDTADRLQFSVDATGAVTEYQYNSDNQITTQIQYSKLAITASWFNGTAVIKSLLTKGTAGTDILTDAAKDRTIQFAYDNSGRLITKTDAAGAVTVNTYDGNSRLVQTKMFGQTTAEDRVTRFFYDNDGKTLATLDGEGYLSENIYNAAGQIIKTIRYANVTASANRATGTLATLKTNLASVNDLATYIYYDDEGRVIGSANEKGVLTETVYDEANNQQQTKIYLTAVTVSGSDTLATLKPRAGTAEVSTTNYDGFGRTLKQIAVDGTTTDYEYDAAGRLIRSVVAANQADADGVSAQRASRIRYNAFGNVTGTVSGVGEATLSANPLPSAINTAIATYGTQKIYDGLGRLTQTIDANGNKTWFYYDEDSRLRFSVNPIGAITETKYNAFDQIASTTQYYTTIPTTGLTGGVATSAIINSFTALANAANDQTITFSYDQRGLLISQTDAEGYVESFTYNNAGQIKTDLKTIAVGATATTQYTYNKRGELIQSISDAGGLNITASNVYDAFGRTIKSTDANSKITTYNYTNSGRSVTITDALSRTNKTDYDVFGRVLKTYDALNNVTTYSYDDVNRSSTITTPENISVTTYKNRNGETAKVVDAKGGVTQYQYNKNGQLIKVTDALGNINQNIYDNSGRLNQSIDALGTITQLSYDAVNRVITRAVDPSGLNLRTQYEFGNGLHQQTKVTEGYGTSSAKVTAYTYDRNGQLKTVITDPTGLALQTSYTYDGLGNTLTVSKGTTVSPGQQVTQYIFDKMGRRTKEIVDPAGLAITTQYKYDSNGNVTRKIDANGNSTWYVYDAENQLIYTVDALGEVTKNSYDLNSRIIQTTNYATAIATTSFGDVVNSITPTANTAADRVINSVYDKDGRLIKTVVDPSGLAITTQNKYDLNGNLTRQVDANNNSTWFIYDANNRLTYTIDALGDVSYNQYDAIGNVTQATRYSTPVATSGFSDIITGIAVTASAADQTVGYVYDAAGRQRFCIDSLGNLSETFFNALGEITEKRQYDNSVQVLMSTARTENSLVSLRGSRSLGDSTTRTCGEKYTYDNVGRVIATTDAAGNTESYGYDAFGNRISLTNKLGQVWSYTYDKANHLTDEISPQVNVAGINNGVVTVNARNVIARTTYDVLGNVISRTEGILRDTSNVEDASSARITRYEYDKANRQIKTILPGYYNSTTGIVDVSSNANNFQRTIEVTYDALGNAILNKIKTGSSSYIYQSKIYDKLGRVVFDIDAMNQVTGYTYDVFDHQTTLTRYTNVAISGTGTIYTAGTVPVVASSTDRTIATDYDKLGRKLEVRQPTISSNYYSSRDSATSNQNSVTGVSDTPTVRYEYDAFGNIIKERKKINDVEWADSWYYYNALNQKIADVDALGYITTYQNDAFGNIVATTEYATAISLANINTTTPPAVTTNANDRSIVFGYDVLNRQTTSTRKNITYYNNYVLTTGDVEIQKMGYDALGNAISQTDALGNVTTHAINALGFITQTTEPARATANSLKTGVNLDPFRNQVNATPVTSYTFNAFGQVISETRNAGGGRGVGNGDVVLTYTYDAAGNEISNTDALGSISTKKYDARGHVISEKQAVSASFSDWTAGNYSYNIETQYEYDLSGRQIATLSIYAEAGVQKKSGQWSLFNSFGESVEERLASGTASTVLNSLSYTTLNTYVYDNAGRMTQKVGIDGTTKYFYDLADRNTRVEQQGNNLTTDGTVTRVTETGYDLLGRAVIQRAPQFKAITTALGTTATMVTPVINQRYDRWGNVTARTDASGVFISYFAYTYNHDNKVITETLPSGITVWDNNGYSSSTPTIVHEIHYDQAGRSVEDVQKSNGVVSRTRRSEYNKVGQLTASVDGTGIRTEFAYDAFGHQIGTRNGVGTVTVDQFDANGNQLTHSVLRKSTSSDANTAANYYFSPIAGVSASSFDPQQVILQSYRYDQANRRIADGKASTTIQSLEQVWVNDSVNEGGHYEYRLVSTPVPGDASYYVYDERNNVISRRSPTGSVKTTEYDSANRKVKETDALNKTLTWTYNAKGQLISHKDLASHTTNYTYNDFGQMASESPSAGNQRYYTYAENGLVKEIKDVWVEAYTSTVAVTSVVNSPGSEGAGGSSATYNSNDTVAQRTLYDYTINGQVAREVRERDRTGERATSATAYYESSGYYYYTFNTTSLYEVNIHEVRSAYDKLGRLTQVMSPAGKEVYGNSIGTTKIFNTSSLNNLTYQYDEFGNRLQVVADYTPVNATTSKTSTLTYRFDKEGRVTNDNGQLIAYDNAGRKLRTERLGETISNPTTETGTSSPITESGASFTTYTYQDLYRYTDTDQLQSISEARVAHDNPGGYSYSLSQITTGQDGNMSVIDKREYEAHGYLTKQTKGSNVTSNYYRADGSLSSQSVSSGGKTSSATSYYYDAVGNLTSYIYGVYDTNGNRQYDITYTNEYAAAGTFDTYHQTKTTAQSSQSGSTTAYTYFYYDGRGNVTSISATGSNAFSRQFINDVNGHAVLKSEAPSGQTPWQQVNIFVGNNQVATVGKENKFDFGLTGATIDTGNSPSQYIVNAGDNLSSIAQSVWGDSALWYLIADANGINASPDAVLTSYVGQNLRIPNVVRNDHNNASTFKPYNPAEIIGDTNPSPIPPPPPKHNCTGLVKVMSTIVAIIVYAVVIYYSDSSTLAGGLSGLAGADAAQRYQSMFDGNYNYLKGAIFPSWGVKDYDWEATTIAGAAGAAGGFVGGAVAGEAGTAAGNALGAAANAATTYTVNYALNAAAGNKPTFSWKALAASTVAAFVTAKISEGFASTEAEASTATTNGTQGSTMKQPFDWGKVAKDAAVNYANAGVTYGINKAFGVDVKWDWADSAVNAFGNALANQIMERSKANSRNSKLEKALDELNVAYDIDENGNPVATQDSKASFDFVKGSLESGHSTSQVIKAINKSGLLEKIRTLDKVGDVESDVYNDRLNNLEIKQKEKELDITGTLLDEVVVVDHGFGNSYNKDGGTIVENTLTTATEIFDKYAAFYEEHSFLAKIAYGGIKAVMSGGVVKPVVVKVVKTAIGEEIQERFSNVVAENVSNWLGGWAERNGVSLDISVGPLTTTIDGQVIGDIGGEVASGIVDTFFDAKAEEIADRGKNVQKIFNDVEMGKAPPYNSRTMRTDMKETHGVDNVKSTTVPPTNKPNVKLAGTQKEITVKRKGINDEGVETLVDTKIRIVFDNKGYPIFDDVTKYTADLDMKKFLSKSEKGQMKMATRDLGEAIKRGSANGFNKAQMDAINSGSAKIPGYTWHHHQDTGRMQLVPEDIHNAVKHVGQQSMVRGQ